MNEYPRIYSVFVYKVQYNKDDFLFKFWKLDSQKNGNKNLKFEKNLVRHH